jgi:hypothetical protein
MGCRRLKFMPWPSCDEVLGWLRDLLKVKVKAPPN